MAHFPTDPFPETVDTKDFLSNIHEEEEEEEETKKESAAIPPKNGIPNCSWGISIGAKPGYVVERHIGSTLGDVVQLSPLQTGILRRFLPNGFVEFLLGSSVVKLEPGYELHINETIAIRRRPELKSKKMANKSAAPHVEPQMIIVLQQIIANLICKESDTLQKLESLYTLNDEVITVGRVMAVYPEGLVLSANLTDSFDYSSWIFLGDNDLIDIKVLGALSSEQQVQEAVAAEYSHLQSLLSLDAGMQVTVGKSEQPQIIESLWWTKGNILGRKAIFDGGRTTSSILNILPYQSTLERKTTEMPPPGYEFLRLYTEFQNADGLLFSICGYDEGGIIANFKPPPPTDGKESESNGRCWVPFSFFEDSVVPPPSAAPSMVGTPKPLLQDMDTSSPNELPTLGKRNNNERQPDNADTNPKKRKEESHAQPIPMPMSMSSPTTAKAPHIVPIQAPSQNP